MIDLAIVVIYFLVVFITAISGKQGKDVSADEYFLSSRSLKWPSIAFSTIATNIQGYQFLGMMGSAYLYGLAQASLEINAIQGILMGAFIFVPIFLKDRVTTITQFIKARLGKTMGLIYSLSNIFIFSTITLGAALFWGAYSADIVFGEYLSFLHEDRLIRVAILVIGLGLFSAIYTYFGGLSAVVKTDIIQFFILLTGGAIVMFVAIHQLGGWSQLYVKTGDLMHLHLPADHETLPWPHIFGLFLLNINYWCFNQSVVQRSLAAKSLKDAQIGLMVGGVMKYVMACLIVIPGIALVGILGANGLEDPDMSFPYLVNTYLPVGLKGLILCALFASLMSTVDSTYNSIATLWSIDIYKVYINKKATEQEIVNVGKRAILMAFISSSVIGIVLLYIKFQDSGVAFTHTLNELRYYINCGIVVIGCSAVFLIAPKQKAAVIAFFATFMAHLVIKGFFPEINYFVRAMWVIIIGFGLAWGLSLTKFVNLKSLIVSDSKQNSILGFALLASLIITHIVFH
jgi:SSS family solute:Na+ symporter